MKETASEELEKILGSIPGLPCLLKNSLFSPAPLWLHLFYMRLAALPGWKKKKSEKKSRKKTMELALLPHIRKKT